MRTTMVRISLAIVLGWVFLARLSGQVLDPYATYLPVKVQARVTGYGEGGYIDVRMCSPEENTTILYSENDGSYDDNSGLASMKPGRTYTVYFNSRCLDSALLQFTAPTGYVMYINDLARTRIQCLPDDTLHIRLEPASSVVQTGLCTSIHPGRIVWSVSVGGLSNGQSAGFIELRQDGSTTPLPNIDSLTYDSASPEVEQIRAGAPWTTHWQIYAPSCLVDITANGVTGSIINFYARTQVGAKGSNGFYSLSGSPIYQYSLERFATYVSAGTVYHLRITQTVNQGISLTLWTELIAYTFASGSGNQICDWIDKPAGATSVTDRSSFQWARSDSSSDMTYYQVDGLAGIQAKDVRNYYGAGGDISDRTVSSEVTQNFTYGGYDGLMLASSRSNNSSWSMSGYYDDFDRLNLCSRAWSPFGNTAYTGTGLYSWTPDPTTGVLTKYDYEADFTGRLVLPKSAITTTNGIVTAKSEVARTTQTIVDQSRTYQGSNATMTLQVETRKDYYDATHYLATQTKTFREDADPQYQFFRRLRHSVANPDGTMAVDVYFRGTFSTSTRTFTAAKNGPEILKLTFNGTNAVGSDSAAMTSYTVGDQTQTTESNFRIVPGISTAKALVEAADSTIICTIDYICTGTVASPSWQIVRRDVNTFTSSFFLASTTRDSGDTSNVWPVVTNVWSGGRLQSTTDENGICTSYTYDQHGRVLTQTVAGKSGLGTSLGSRTTTYEYDYRGNKTKETVSSSGTTETLISTWTYDDLGRVLTETKPGYDTSGTSTTSASTTSYSYDYANRTTTVTLPDGSTQTEIKNLDGTVASRTGTAGVAEYYTYNVTSSGQRYTRVNYGSATSSRYKETWTDMLGRAIKTSQPATSGTFDQTSSYDDYLGTNTGRVVATTRTGTAPTLLQYNTMSQPVRSGLDVDSTGTLALSSNDRIGDAATTFESADGAWWLKKTNYVYPFTGSSASTAVITSIVRQRLTGLTASLRAETRATDADGNASTVTLVVDASNAVATTTTHVPGASVDQVEKSLNGLPVEATGHDGITVKKRYDVLWRPIADIQPRTGTELNPSVQTTYWPNTAWTKEVKDATGNRLSFASYDAAGRKTYTEDANSKRTYFAYNKRAQVIRQWGAATYPVEYAYNSLGEKIAMRTFRNPTQDFTTSTWPLSDGGSDPANPDPTLWGAGDKTTWAYDAATGLLLSKTDASSHAVTYTYTAAGKLATREWSRVIASGTNAGQHVRATYAYDSATGEQTGISYNDGTPSLSYTYTRLGQSDSVTDGATGVHDFVYDSSYPQRLSCEAFDTFYGSRVMTRLYETTGVIGRARGFQLGSSVGSNSEVEQNYGFAADSGRFNALTTVSTPLTTGASRTFHYGYETNSVLLKTLWTDDNAFFVTRSFEANRDVLTSVDTKWGQTASTSLTKYAYHSNTLAQRDSLVQTGDAFTAYSGSDHAIHETFAYNDRGELKQAPTFNGNNAADTSSPIANRQHEFDYDLIGNRKWAGVTGNSADRKNYTANALNQLTSRDNPLAPFGGTQTFTYDADGNITNDGLWDYTWDAENRLVRMVATNNSVLAGNPNLWIDFKYDYMGRRVEKKVINQTSSTVVTWRRFLYDGWSIIAEYSVSPQSSALSPLRSYTWGLDIARSMTDAGGVGALLQIADYASGKTFLPTYDGNGNIVSLINATSGAIAAVYEYSPFGEQIRAEINDSTIADQPFRFSTKYYDAETNFYDYGHRYYSPSQGRFLGRDPIEEKGGLHLYAFCLNDAINGYDVLGNAPTWVDTATWQQQEAFDYAYNAAGGNINSAAFTQGLQQWWADYSDPNGGSGATSAEAADFANETKVALGLGDAPIGQLSVGAYTFDQNGNLTSFTGNNVPALNTGKVATILYGPMTTSAGVNIAHTQDRWDVPNPGESFWHFAFRSTEAFRSSPEGIDSFLRTMNFGVTSIPNRVRKAPVTTAQSVADKLRRYLLNPDHPIGGPKAQWFEKALGFTRANAGDLAKQLVFDEAKAIQTDVTKYGTKFNLLIDVVGANGKTIPVQTAWIRGADGVVKLVTAMPGD